MAVLDPGLALRTAVARRIAWPRAAVLVPAVLLLCFAAEAALFVPFAYLNRDEGWYLLSGRLVYDGQVPYRDFPYFQMPLGPYVFGVAGSVISSPIIAGRIIAAALGLVSVALVLRIGARLGGLAVGAIAVAVLLLSPDFIVASTTARAEAIVIPLVLLALLVVLERPRGAFGFAAAPALLLVATGARLSFLPVFGIALIFCYWSARPTTREMVAGCVALAAIAVAVALPVLISDPRRSFFDIWTSQSIRNAQFLPRSPAFYQTLAQRMWFLIIPSTTFFVVLVPLLLVWIHAGEQALRGWRPRAFGFGADPLANQLLIAAFGLLCWIPFAGFNHQEARYFVPSFALLAIAAADAGVRAHRGLLGEAMRYAPALMAVLFVGYAAFQVTMVPQVLDTTDVQQNRDVAAYVRSLAGPDGRIVTLNPALALDADRPLPSSLVMGQFSFWPKFSSSRAANVDMVNVDLLEQEMLDPRTKVIALDDYDLGLIAQFRQEAPGVSPTAPWPFKLFPSVAAQYRLARTVPKFGQFSDTLYILVRVR